MNQFGEFGFIRVAACAPAVALGDPAENARRIAAEFHQLASEGAAVVLFPELSATGYTCEDLFFTQALLDATRDALTSLVRATSGTHAVLVVGAPWMLTDGRLVNCAFVAARGRLLGAVPKVAQPNYAEFYEKRWFVSGAGLDLGIDDPAFGPFRLATDQLFEVGATRFAIEVCEDLWAPDPIGNRHALAGADVILNPSASTELIGKADYRRDLVKMASGQRICGYVYAAAGATESTKDVVFGGHLLAAENGQLVAESQRFELTATRIVVEFDRDKLRHDRASNNTFAAADRPPPYAIVDTGVTPPPLATLGRAFARQPFVPADEHEFGARAREVLSIQATGLARRAIAARAQTLVIGLSGGLDSTLAYLVCLDALAKAQQPPAQLHALTMPGPGTSAGTLKSARALAKAGGSTLVEIPITAAVERHLQDIEQPPGRHDVVFENAQARERTQVLFDYANKLGGIVVGTGDLSELALGWCTFNGDQMANYNVNAGVPKTMISYLVRWYARHRAPNNLAKVLDGVLKTPISPELLPPAADGSISQATESIIGPYELHDFFLYHYLRNGFAPAKIFALAGLAFGDGYPRDTVKRWLKLFFTRFFATQFKRTTLPPGPKVGTVSLSPRGDWRMPDEASADALIAGIDSL
ncbi:MAG TPA: NAD(+) synthase [Pseudomonadales bacterium]|nr:NAD(+) synthase [Pseudomonadales bacterium]